MMHEYFYILCLERIWWFVKVTKDNHPSSWLHALITVKYVTMLLKCFYAQAHAVTCHQEYIILYYELLMSL